MNEKTDAGVHRARVKSDALKKKKKKRDVKQTTGWRGLETRKGSLGGKHKFGGCQDTEMWAVR